MKGKEKEKRNDGSRGKREGEDESVGDSVEEKRIRRKVKEREMIKVKCWE